MNIHAQENMCYLAEHIHFFEFHTVHARAFKQQLQQWWASETRSPADAVLLQAEFLRLCEADPVAAACGWFRRSGEIPERLAWLEERLGIPEAGLPVCEISPRCMEAYFIREENCFLGLMPPEERKQWTDPLVSEWYSSLRLDLKTVRSRLEQHMQTLQKSTYLPIYTTTDNFTGVKSLIHGAYTAVTLWLLPGWLRLLRAAAGSLAANSFDWQMTNDLLQQMPESAGLPLLLLVFMLVPEVVGLAGIPQALWEIYFLFYRWTAMGILWLRFRRSQRHIRRLLNKTQRQTQQLLKNQYRWSASKTMAFGRLYFRMPQWVRVGINPFFAPDRGLEGVRESFQIYPQTARAGTSTRTIPDSSAWMRAIFCLCLAAVFLCDLPSLLSSLLKTLGIG